MTWEIVALTLGVGGLALGFYWLRTSARRVTSVSELEERISRLERLQPPQEGAPVYPRGLGPAPRIGGRF